MLKLPLKYYDESGRILPPSWFYWLSLLLCVDWIAFVFSLASRTQTATLLAFFYPQRESLGVGLIASAPALLSLLLVSQRERLWKKGFIHWRRAVIPCVQLAILSLLTVQFYYAMHHQWRFELVTGAKLLIYTIALYAISSSRHIRWMVQDWAILNVTEEKSG